MWSKCYLGVCNNGTVSAKDRSSEKLSLFLLAIYQNLHAVDFFVECNTFSLIITAN